MPSVLVVGAGPVGLTAAIELARRKIDVCIIDRKSKREPLSKALAIHPRTLELLESSGLSSRLIEAGYKATKLHLCDGSKPRLTLHVDRLRHRYPYIVLLEQYRTEEILEKRLNELGISVEWGCELIDCSQTESQVTAELTGGTTTTFDYLIGADGAHSWVRKSVGIEFAGRRYPNEWNFIDARMSWSGQCHEIWLHALPEGRIGVVLPIKPGLYRIATNGEEASIAIPKDADVHEIVWNSTFRIQIRQAERYQEGRLFIAGDAAHIHSPAGGRGMNLGIEDAIFLAEKIALGRTESYTSERRPVGHRVIQYTELLVRLNSLQNPLLKTLRNHLLFPILRLPPLQQRLLKQVTGIGGRMPEPYPSLL
jgi:2-polyprenyl-6-methoxyphenol hydroxylase-like FAD-dependent oxidoreductase